MPDRVKEGTTIMFNERRSFLDNNLKSKDLFEDNHLRLQKEKLTSTPTTQRANIIMKANVSLSKSLIEECKKLMTNTTFSKTILHQSHHMF